MIYKKCDIAKNILLGSSVAILVSCTLFFLVTYIIEAADNPHQGPKHIIFILADDLGWNDVSYHGSPQIPTPNIDAMAASGIIFTRHYTAPQCTPSRASLMTGRYPTNTGLQHFVIQANEPVGLPLNLTIMPQYFKKLGYSTHLVGKWHLGYHKKEYTPTYRGFDSFFGYWNGVIDHFDHTNYESEITWGVDLHNGTEIVNHLRGRYLADILSEKAEDIISKHNTSQPLFLLLSQIVPHSGNPFQRLQALPEHVRKFKHIKDLKRRIYAGGVSALDDSVGRMFAALDQKSMLENSIVIFASDNGAEARGHRGGQGSNWPLRGSKIHLWEGGVRTPAVIWSPLLNLRKPRTSTQWLHISDWLPTLYAAVGGEKDVLGKMDGLNLWQDIVDDLPSQRKEILLNVDPIYGMSSLIMNDYKLVNGTTPEEKDSWYGPSGHGEPNVSSMDEWVWKNGSVVKSIMEKNGHWLLETPDQWRLNASVKCGTIYCPEVDGVCNAKVAPCLFNIVDDPCECINLAAKMPDMVAQMTDRIKELNTTSVHPIMGQQDPKGDPRCYGFKYVSWLDEEYQTECYGL